MLGLVPFNGLDTPDPKVLGKAVGVYGIYGPKSYVLSLPGNGHKGQRRSIHHCTSLSSSPGVLVSTAHAWLLHLRMWSQATSMGYGLFKHNPSVEAV
jgi:hypothetical protein